MGHKNGGKKEGSRQLWVEKAQSNIGDGIEGVGLGPEIGLRQQKNDKCLKKRDKGRGIGMTR